MGILDYNILKLGNKDFKVEKKNISWDEVLNNKNDFYSDISSIVLNEETLYYLVVNNNDSKSIFLNLNSQQKSKLKIVFNRLFKNPETFYDNYKKQVDLIEKLESIDNINDFSSFASSIGFKKISNEKDLIKAKRRLKSSIKSESIYGVFGEIMLYTVVENLMNNRNIIISKLNYISARGTPVYGNDGIFIDKDNKVLYFGEAKFTFDLRAAIEQALISMEKVFYKVDEDEEFLLIQGSSFKNDFDESMFDEQSLKLYKKCIIIFAFHGEEYSNVEIHKIIESSISRFDKIFQSRLMFEIISFPILSKEDLKKELSRQVQEKYDDSR